MLAYEVTGPATVRGVGAADKGAGARGSRASGLGFIGLVYMPLI
jgi:hypothetical protein